METSAQAKRFGALRSRLIVVLSALGPGFITANADNDVGSILTYSQAGAAFGYSLLWTLVPITLELIVIQEMAARLGVRTGKGFARLIREQTGLRSAWLVVLCLSLGNFGNLVAEFAGLASGMEMLGLSRYLAVPLGAALLMWVIFVGAATGWNAFCSYSQWLTSPIRLLPSWLTPTGVRPYMTHSSPGSRKPRIICS